ncbi:MAG: L,D-transpeptidase [Phycisphaerae bacterium]|nr:L,D-transpeptidase [Phycisphaerae bacterium]
MRNRRLWLIAITIALLVQAIAGIVAYADGPEECPYGVDGNGDCILAVSELTALERRAINAEISAHPAPDVTPLTPDNTLLYNRNYQRVLQQVTIYDTPNGNPIGTLDPGFNFFTTISRQGTWVEVNPGQWVEDQYLGGAHVSEFTGVLLNEPPAYTFAWMLLDTKPSARPGAEPLPGTPWMARYTLVNIYATALVDGWQWYLVGPGQWVHQTRLGQITPIERPEGVSGRWVAIDLYEQTLVAYEDDRMVFATLISSGLPDWSTNEGLFQIWDRHESTPMSGAEGAPDFYYLEEVPWTMYFDDAIGLHGTYWHDGFGYRHSHGCVNLTITDSHWLYQWTADGYEDAYVFVYSSGTYQ